MSQAELTAQNIRTYTLKNCSFSATKRCGATSTGGLHEREDGEATDFVRSPKRSR